jgi:hypothetical protein
MVTARRGTGLKPIGAVCDPPCSHAGGNSCDERPPERQSEVRDEAKAGECQPEYFALHGDSLPKCAMQKRYRANLCADT